MLCLSALFSTRGSAFPSVAEGSKLDAGLAAAATTYSRGAIEVLTLQVGTYEFLTIHLPLIRS